MTKKNRLAVASANSEGEIVRWFGWLIPLEHVHIGEQLVFGLDSFGELEAMVACYYSYFGNPAVGTAALVSLGLTLVLLLQVATLTGGRWRLVAAGFFSVMAIAEAHHVVRSLMRAVYAPGLVTSIGCFWAGFTLLRRVVQEWPATGWTADPQMAAA